MFSLVFLADNSCSNEAQSVQDVSPSIPTYLQFDDEQSSDDNVKVNSVTPGFATQEDGARSRSHRY